MMLKAICLLCLMVPVARAAVIQCVQCEVLYEALDTKAKVDAAAACLKGTTTKTDCAQITPAGGSAADADKCIFVEDTTNKKLTRGCGLVADAATCKATIPAGTTCCDTGTTGFCTATKILCNKCGESDAKCNAITQLSEMTQYGKDYFCIDAGKCYEQADLSIRGCGACPAGKTCEPTAGCTTDLCNKTQFKKAATTEGAGGITSSILLIGLAYLLTL